MKFVLFIFYFSHNIAKNIYVSPRNKKNASELADKYKEITIAKDN